MRGKQPSVHILIVNWNGKHHLENCLPSLTKSPYLNCQVVILDNGSDDGSQDWVRSSFPAIKLVEINQNLGFATANNLGMRAALESGADYVALLNNDTRVEPDWLDVLVDTAETDSNIAICQARQRTWDGQAEIRFRFIPEWAEAQAYKIAVQSPGPATPTAFASGCAILIRSHALKEIGLFDERYFMYVEDVDLALRAWIAGYKVMDVPASTVYHQVAGSGSQKAQRLFWGYRNQLTTILKLYQLETLCSYTKPIVRRWLRNRYALRPVLASLQILPGTLTRRQQVQRNRKVPDARFLELCRL